MLKISETRLKGERLITREERHRVMDDDTQHMPGTLSTPGRVQYIHVFLLRCPVSIFNRGVGRGLRVIGWSGRTWCVYLTLIGASYVQLFFFLLSPLSSNPRLNQQCAIKAHPSRLKRVLLRSALVLSHVLFAQRVDWLGLVPEESCTSR